MNDEVYPLSPKHTHFYFYKEGSCFDKCDSSDWLQFHHVKKMIRRMLNEDPEFDASESSDSSSDSQLDVSEKSNSDSD